eukprot:sb/3471625/
MMAKEGMITVRAPLHYLPVQVSQSVPSHIPQPKNQKQSWYDFTGNVNGTHQAARPNKILKLTGYHHIQSGTIKDKTGTPTTSLAESIKNLLDYHFGGNTTTVHNLKYSKTEAGHENETFSKDKIERAINALPPNKAPGPDGSDPDLVTPDLVTPRFSDRINFPRYRKLTAFDPDLVATPI